MRSSTPRSARSREILGGGSNRVIGPDFRFSPTEADTITGQLLFSRSETPDRPEEAAEWDGRTVSGHGADVWWAHSTEKVDWAVEYKDFSDGFRADLGFVPQVGFREGFVDGGYTFRPEGFFSRVRPSVIGQSVETRTNPELYAEPVEERSGTFSASALVAYRLNWQSVVFLGYGDARTLSEEGALPPENRQLFLKVSYAFQR